MNNFRANQRGMALVLSCLVITLVTAYGSAMMVQSLTEHRAVTRYSDLALAFQLAESGADQAIVNLQDGNEDDIVSTELYDGNYSAEIEDLGGGLYEITSHGTVGQTQRNIEVVVSLGGESVFQYGLFGEDSITLKKEAHTDSYNSAEGDYDEDTANENGNVATNNTADDSITIAKDSVIKGQVLAGPDMETPEDAVSLSEPVTITANPDIASASEGLELPAIDTSGLECEESFTLPANDTYTFTEAHGPYCFESLEADTGSVVAVSGNVTVYAGAVNFNKNFEVNTEGDPTQLILKVYGTSDVVVNKEGTFVGAIYAPGLKVHFKKAATIYGAVTAEDIEVDKDLTLHYDEDLINYGPTINEEATVESWREL